MKRLALTLPLSTLLMGAAVPPEQANPPALGGLPYLPHCTQLDPVQYQPDFYHWGPTINGVHQAWYPVPVSWDVTATYAELDAAGLCSKDGVPVPFEASIPHVEPPPTLPVSNAVAEVSESAPTTRLSGPEKFHDPSSWPEKGTSEDILHKNMGWGRYAVLEEIKEEAYPGPKVLGALALLVLAAFNRGAIKEFISGDSDPESTFLKDCLKEEERANREYALANKREPISISSGVTEPSPFLSDQVFPDADYLKAVNVQRILEDQSAFDAWKRVNGLDQVEPSAGVSEPTSESEPPSPANPYEPGGSAGSNHSEKPVQLGGSRTGSESGSEASRSSYEFHLAKSFRYGGVSKQDHLRMFNGEAPYDLYSDDSFVVSVCRTGLEAGLSMNKIKDSFYHIEDNGGKIIRKKPLHKGGGKSWARFQDLFSIAKEKYNSFHGIGTEEDG